jgi:addiction module RelB/DinJ family antitoxin
MAETRLSVRVDSATKRNAETVFKALGLNMSTGINIFLTHVARNRVIPFSLDLGDDPLENRMRNAIKIKMNKTLTAGAPVALFDDVQNRPYLEYPDGRRVYELD